jgi:glycine/D-amino acid oxidase-like deaminating enzyme
MLPEPFWTHTCPRPDDLPVADNLPESADVAVIGGGFTGLSAARTLAKSGASVVVLEGETIGWGASSRNGGMTGCGLKRGSQAIFRRYDEKYGHAFWQASLDAFGLVKEFVFTEGVDCDFSENGSICLAYKPSHFEDFKAEAEWNRRVLGHEMRLVSPSELNNEIGSKAFFGGIIDEHGAGLHPAKFAFGVARVAAKYGATLVENAPVTRLEKSGGGFTVHTRRGRSRVREVIAATNGYTESLVPGLKSRVLPVGSYIIVTEPLSSDLQKEISPKGRMMWDAKWFLNYFRLTPDGRMLWGGRNNLSTDLDLAESAKILRGQMLRAFPQVAGVPVTHSWSGKLGLTFDLMPHIGRVGGVHYAMGYGGHGFHAALYLGREVAQLLTGEKTASPFAEIPHPTYFFYRNKTWFLPLAARYYRLLDAIG